jgi:4a-hydroxytetrahydrobiopterin dehydratase
MSHHWIERNNALEREFRFADFSEAFAFMARVALLAERMDHHPEWTNVWNRVTIRLSTHSAGGRVTDKDRALAAAIDRLVAEDRAGEPRSGEP